MEPSVCCLILSWNDSENTLACLKSFEQDDYGNKTVVVIDNGSTDGSLEKIQAAYPSVTYLENDENLLWAGGNNVGLRWALDRDYDYIILLNNDITVAPDMLTKLVNYAESDMSCGILGPKIYYHSRRNLIWYAGAVVALWRGHLRHLGIREVDSGQYDEVCETGYVTGCAMMIRQKVLEDIGLIDTHFNFYGEDVDYALRAHKAGYTVVYVPSGTMWHKVSESIGASSWRKIRMKAMAHLRLIRRHAPVWSWFTTIPLFLAWEIVRAAWSIMFNHPARLK